MIYYKRHENKLYPQHYWSNHNTYHTNSPGYIHKFFRQCSEKSIKNFIEMLEDPDPEVGGGLNDDTRIYKGINSKGEESVYIFNETWNREINTDFDDDKELYDHLDELEASGGPVDKVDKYQLIKVLKTWLELPKTKNEYALLWADKKNNIYLEGILDKTSLIKRIKEVQKLERQFDPKNEIPIPILEEEN